MGTREKLAMILCGVLLAGCGVTYPKHQGAVKLVPALKDGLMQITHQTELPLYAPIKLFIPIHGKMSGYSFATKNSYGITLVDGLSHPMPFNSSPLAAYQDGKEIFSYSVIRSSSRAHVSIWALLASYSLMGPAGLPKLTGGATRLSHGREAHWDQKLHLIWWYQSRWLFLVEAKSQTQATATARQLSQEVTPQLPGAHGLFVSVPQATIADWDQKQDVIAIDDAKTSSTGLLSLVESYRIIPRLELGKVAQ